MANFCDRRKRARKNVESNTSSIEAGYERSFDAEATIVSDAPTTSEVSSSSSSVVFPSSTTKDASSTNDDIISDLPSTMKSFELDGCDNTADADGSSRKRKHHSVLSSRSAVQAFVCPLTLEIMFDPVLDAQGNTFERHAVMTWLDTNRISPISRQPLHPSMLVPNNSLKSLIHEYMGADWVQRKQLENEERKSTQQQTEEPKNATPQSKATSEVERSRGKIDAFLAHMSLNGGSGNNASSPCLKLNSQGCAAFRYNGVTVVLDVAGAAGAGMFSLYTRDLLPKHILNGTLCSIGLGGSSPALVVKNRLLQLNFLQGETRGGCLSLKKHSSNEEEVIFSYNDRVSELCAVDLNNILLNFVETAISLRTKLVSVHAMALVQQAQLATQQPIAQSTTNLPMRNIDAAVVYADSQQELH